MPAWSVPGCHNGHAQPFGNTNQQILQSECQRVSLCRLPVTFGGSIMMVKGICPNLGRMQCPLATIDHTSSTQWLVDHTF